MKKNIILLFGLLLCASVSGGNAFAAISNPLSSIFHDDDGAELFITTESQIFFSWEFADLGQRKGIAEFGFFFDGTDTSLPENRITVFGTEDNNLLELAFVNFNSGRVFDLDDFQVQSTFVIAGTGKFGFYYAASIDDDQGGILEFIAYSVSDFNEAGQDLAFTFPAKIMENSYLVTFESPLHDPMTFNLITGIQPVSAPVPSSMALMASALLGLIPFARRRKRG